MLLCCVIFIGSYNLSDTKTMYVVTVTALLCTAFCSSQARTVEQDKVDDHSRTDQVPDDSFPWKNSAAAPTLTSDQRVALGFDQMPKTNRYLHSSPESAHDDDGFVAMGEQDKEQQQFPESDSVFTLMSRKPWFVDPQIVTPVSPQGLNVSRGLALKCNVTAGGVANCTHLGLRAIPQDLPHNITRLYLGHNNIRDEALYSGVFKNYSKLNVLMLDHNYLSRLPEGVFDGLVQLQALVLFNNSIQYDQHLNESLAFVPLNRSLEYLVLNRNENQTKYSSLKIYPDQALSVLTELRALYLDGLQKKDFGTGFKKLEKLVNLSLAGFNEGYCNIITLKNTTFRYLNSLEHLNIADCHLNGSLVADSTFVPLIRLQSLDVSNNFHLGLDAVGNFMRGLKNNSNFSHLRIVRIVERFVPCIIIYKYTLRHFTTSALKTIEAMGNEIEMIEKGALKFLPSGLISVNLINNKIMFGAYWEDMGHLDSLENIQLDRDLQPRQFPVHFPTSKISCTHPGQYSTNENSLTAQSQEYVHDEEPLSIGKKFILPLPPKLERFSMHSGGLVYTVNNITFCGNNSLKHVDLSKNVFQDLIGPITGLSYLETLNVSDAFIEYIGRDFFNEFPSLKYLSLHRNLLGQCLSVDTEGNVFDNLVNLRYLDISFNNLFKLPPNIFQNLSRLETIDLSTNRLSHIDLDIHNMGSLQFLNLHKNSIDSLPLRMRQHLSELSVKVNMRQNPIRCDCDNLDFLEWVVASKPFGNNYEHYFCKYPSEDRNAVEMKDGYAEEVARLRKMCAHNYALFSGVISATVSMILLIIMAMAYRFRWSLRYWYQAARLFISSTKRASEGEFSYDVFISYAKEDTDFVVQEIQKHLQERGLSILVHGEHFQAGRQITDNILSAIRDSRKTLVLVTNNMLKSFWCLYELQMARMESISTGREVLVFLFREEICPLQMKADVLAYIKTNTYIYYPEEEEHRSRFWDKLARDLEG